MIYTGQISNWTSKIDQHQDIIITFNQMSGRKSIRAICNLNEDDIEVLHSTESIISLFSDGKNYFIELVEDQQKTKLVNKIAITPHMSAGKQIKTIKDGKSLAIHFTTLD